VLEVVVAIVAVIVELITTVLVDGDNWREHGVHRLSMQGKARRR